MFIHVKLQSNQACDLREVVYGRKDGRKDRRGTDSDHNSDPSAFWYGPTDDGWKVMTFGSLSL